MQKELKYVFVTKMVWFFSKVLPTYTYIPWFLLKKDISCKCENWESHFCIFSPLSPVLVRSTYFLNMLNFHVILVVSSQHVRIWSMQQLHYIFAIFALDRDVDAPFQYQKSEREKMHLHLHTDLNLILQFIDYIFYFFKSMVKFQAYPDYFFFRIDTNL